MGVENGLSGHMVMAALAKASYEICHASRHGVHRRRGATDDIGDLPNDAVRRRHAGKTVRVPHAATYRTVSIAADR
jgi:hypothetical protein